MPKPSRSILPAPKSSERHEFEIVDPTHNPDMHGTFAGAPVYRAGIQQFVTLTEQQAQFYLASGAIVPVKPLPVAQPYRLKGHAPPPEEPTS